MEQPLDLGPVIIRVAGWPIETINKLNSPRLTEAVDQWIEYEEVVRSDSTRLSEVIYALIPKIHDVALRGSMLSFRRCLRRSTEPLSSGFVNTILSSKAIPLQFKELVRCHSQARVALAVKRKELESAYESSLIAEQDEVHRIAADPVFRKAIYMASPTTFDALLKADRKGEIGRRNKRLSSTLHSYVMRCVGRATPNSLWAGTAIETPSASDEPTTHIRVDPAPGKVVFYPKLLPFVRALQVLARRSPWWKEIPLRLHPALWQVGNRREKMLASLSSADHLLLSDLLSLFSATSTRLPHEVRDHLIAQNAGWSEAEAEKAVYQMLNVGLLWSTLELPGSYSDPWQALEAILLQVPDSERNYWRVAVRALRKICCKLNLDYFSMPPSDLQSRMRAARACVNRLLTRYGIAALGEDAHVLVADMRSPFRVSISSSLRKRIAHSLRAYWAFDWYGMGELQAVVDRKREFSELRSGEDLTLAEFVRRQNALRNSAGYDPFTHQRDRPQPLDDEISPRAARGLIVGPWEQVAQSIDDLVVKGKAQSIFARWNEELGGVFKDKRYRLHWRIVADNTTSPLPPGSALMRLEIRGLDCSIRIGSVPPDPSAFYSRFAPLFVEEGRRVDPFSKWYQRSLRSVEALFPELHFVDVSIRRVVNLNAASRPRFSAQILDGCCQNDGLLGSLRIQLGTNGVPNLHIPGVYSAVLPLPHSAVSISAPDPYSRCLLGVSFLLGRPSLMSPLPRFSAEIDRWHHLPRLSIDETTVVTAERWTPPRSVVEELSRRPGLDCYIAWRRFSRNAQLPRLVYAKYGARQTETLIGIDSVLAIESLSRTLAAHGGIFLLQEAVPFPSESWLCDSDGQHYVAELAVAWQGEAAFWMKYVSEAAEVQSLRHAVM